MFKTDIKVRFNHVDFARIVFYPRYYEMFNQVIEEWCEEVLGYDFRRLDDEFKAGLPVASIDANFSNPSRLGDVLTFTLSVERVGRSSIVLMIDAMVEEELRLSATLTIVYIVKSGDGGFSPSEIPDQLRYLIMLV